MSKKRYGPYSLGIFGLFVLSTNTLAFAEVMNLQSNSDFFYLGEDIQFFGTVEKGSTGLVTIVIHDSNDEFILLEQALINPDNSFETTIHVNENFPNSGLYEVTGFILNMTKGVTSDFAVSFDDVSPSLNLEPSENETKTTTPVYPVDIDIKTNVESTVSETKIASFVDLDKDPQHYLDRYYNENSYKLWFDRNYPELTIEDAVGYSPNNVEESNSTTPRLDKKEFIPKAQASTITIPDTINSSTTVQNNNSEIAQVSLVIAALGILFGAVYGIKRQVDNNSKQISINKNTITKKLIYPFIGLTPKTILQTRLAKGEITLEEYEKLKLKLD